MDSILQNWVMEQGLRHQGALLTAIRGCDTVPKEDPSKILVRNLRGEILKCFCGDPAKAVSFIETSIPAELERRMRTFLKDHDSYPLHFVTHLMQAAEVIGYKKPQAQWLWFYEKMCKSLHVNPESEPQLDARLLASEDAFGKLAQI